MRTIIHLTRIARWAAPVIGLLSLSLVASAQISLVHATACGPQTFPTTTCAIPATGTGNLLVVGWASANGGGGATISGMTDNVGNIYTEAGGARSTDTAANTMADIWYAQNSVAGATAVAVTPNSSESGTVMIWEFSGVQLYSPLDQTTVLNSQSAVRSPAGASVVTTSPSEVVVSVANLQGAATSMHNGNAFTSDSTAGGEGWAHLITSAAGTYTPQWRVTTAGTYSSSTVSFVAAGSGASACDLNQDGAVNVVDVQLAVNMDLGTMACPSDLDGGVCNMALVQQIVNAALGQTCSATITAVSHSVSLSWTASNSANVAGYNVYRSGTTGGPYTQLNTTLVATTTFVDNNVTAGQTYYYVTTAVDTSSNPSTYSNQAQATVPTP